MSAELPIGRRLARLESLICKKAKENRKDDKFFYYVGKADGLRAALMERKKLETQEEELKMKIQKHGHVELSLKEFTDFVSPPYKKMLWHRLLPLVEKKRKKEFKEIAQRIVGSTYSKERLEGKTKQWRQLCCDCLRWLGFSDGELRCPECKSRGLRQKRLKAQRKVDKERRKRFARARFGVCE